MIGHVTGEIIPPNTDLEAADFFHPELKEVTCQINCKQTGNLFRLLYRGHNPNAKIMPSKVAGKYVMAIKAIRDIADQEEITL
jgi:SET domain-containing protein